MWILGAIALLIFLPVDSVLWMTSVPGRSHAGPLPPLPPDQAQLAARLQDHVRTVASRPHNVGHPHELERAALYIETTLASLGYEVHRQPFRADGREVRNIEVVIEPAASVKGARTLVVGAHYDSMPRAQTTTGPERRACSSLPGSSRTFGEQRPSGSGWCCSSTRSHPTSKVFSEPTGGQDLFVIGRRYWTECMRRAEQAKKPSRVARR